MKSLKNMESLNSKKFDMSTTGRVMGGMTTYGPDVQTTIMHASGTDYKRVTYNPAGYPEGTQGWDASPAR